GGSSAKNTIQSGQARGILLLGSDRDPKMSRQTVIRDRADDHPLPKQILEYRERRLTQVQRDEIADARNVVPSPLIEGPAQLIHALPIQRHAPGQMVSIIQRRSRRGQRYRIDVERLPPAI